MRPLAGLCTLVLAACRAPAPAADPPVDAAPPPHASAQGPTAAATPTAPRSVPAGPANLLVPGERVGPIGATTSYAELVERYGAAVKATSIGLGEGEEVAGVWLGEGTDTGLQIAWHDDARTRPSLVVLTGPGFRTPAGLGVGSKLSEIVAALGPIRVLGWEWDYSGALLLQGTAWDAEKVHLLVQVAPSDVDDGPRRAAYEATIGDAEFASDHPAMILLDPTVRSIRMVFDP